MQERINDYMVSKVKSAFFLATLSSLVLVDSAKADLNSKLTIEVDGLNSQNGEVCLKLFSASSGFPYTNNNVVEKQCVKITNNPLTITLNEIPSGSYAAAIFHDIYGDRKLRRNSLGMPTEGYGFSNNPIVRNGPPKYGDCVFVVAGSDTTIKIQMNYSTEN